MLSRAFAKTWQRLWEEPENRVLLEQELFELADQLTPADTQEVLDQLKPSKLVRPHLMSFLPQEETTSELLPCD